MPLTGAGLPNMDAATVGTWGQRDVPTDATAVFRASGVPATSPPSAADWPYAALTYIDVNGRPVNTAGYGGTADPDTGAARTPTWQVATTE